MKRYSIEIKLVLTRTSVCQALVIILAKLSCCPTSGVASPKIWGDKKFRGGKMFDFRRITLFCLEKRLSKHKMTMFSKIWRVWPLWLRLCVRLGLKCWSRTSFRAVITDYQCGGTHYSATISHELDCAGL